ncbi:hypothetical protein SISNIDRAFT_198286 [Sistotremastrum niveocremeum HHB9708]|uniref:CCHC-type domain-containing protein n=1 Tax=Sistotremastrum niveocremeum HHB9708 TaxID=1314777 RepID=A0A164ZLK9_9AGAM|nr:hypothetical protein SISNIDRAFT_198286 [Sistotremastrum niveocremeum HHB9708]
MAEAEASFLEEEPSGFLEYFGYDDKRYFDLSDEDGVEIKKPVIICSRCGESGHIARKCPNLICDTCGLRNEHTTRSCPISYTGSEDCDRCGSNQHPSNQCPSLWRVYSYVSDETRAATLSARAKKATQLLGEGGEGYIARDEWCYRCGNCGHLGDDCNQSMSSPQIVGPSAFGSMNVASGPFADLALEPGPSRSTHQRWKPESSSRPSNGYSRRDDRDRERDRRRRNDDLRPSRASEPDRWHGGNGPRRNDERYRPDRSQSPVPRRQWSPPPSERTSPPSQGRHDGHPSGSRRQRSPPRPRPRGPNGRIDLGYDDPEEEYVPRPRYRGGYRK